MVYSTSKLILSLGILFTGLQTSQANQLALGDSTKKSNLRDFLAKGKLEGHFRYYFMGSDNAPGLSDAYAHAVGFSLGYESPRKHGFSIAASGSAVVRLDASDLAQADPKTGQPNRYELGLFDVLAPTNKLPIPRLENLHINYYFKKSFIRLGKQKIQTPFINPQDGRMRPTLVDGITANVKLLPWLDFQGGYLIGIAPRSTSTWFKIGESVGIYPVGINPQGKPSAYFGKTSSDWIAYASLKAKITKRFELEAWHQAVDNISTTSLGQLTWKSPVSVGKNIDFSASYQGIYQSTLGNGGNVDTLLAYSKPGSFVWIHGGRIALERQKSWRLEMNYTQIGNTGRYLMPREWGRDPFFTFMPRERNEGFGDVQAVNGVISKTFTKLHVIAKAGYGRYYIPDPKRVALNKYGFPAYQQVNIELRYIPQGVLSGMDFMLLYVYKGAISETYSNQRYIYNKVNMSLWNVMVNINF